MKLMNFRGWIAKAIDLFATGKKEINTSDVGVERVAADSPPPRIPLRFNLKILVIADTHNCLTEEELEGKAADVCLLLGDLSGRDMRIIKRNIKTMPIYGVLGNHDDWDLYETYGVENIHGNAVEVRGVKIAGLQGSIRYKSTDCPLYTDEESSQIAEAMSTADILISHDSPKNLHGEWDFVHSGLQGVTDYCKKYNVPLNLHGHHHVNEKNVLSNGTLSVCCYKVRLLETNTFEVL